MAIEFEGGVVIGADSRTTTGYVYVDHIMSHCATDLDSKRLNYSSYCQNLVLLIDQCPVNY
jgi:hypothetical protein